MSWPWSELGLPGPSDLAAVRHAYAECLKTTHPEEDPEGFQRLNEAYQQARQLARRGGRSAQQSASPTAPLTRPAAPRPPRPSQPAAETSSPALEELFGSKPEKSAAPTESAPPAQETPRPAAKGSQALDELFAAPPTEPTPPAEESPRPSDKESPALDELFAPPPQEAPRPPEERSAGEPESVNAFESEQARRAEEREQAAQARREAFFQKYSASTPQEEEQLKRRWARIEAALTMAEVLLDSGAPLDQWTDYLHSSVFLMIKGDPEFVAGFEELLRAAAGLPDNVKGELLRAFSGMDAQRVPQVWHGIHKILSGRTPQTDQPGHSPDVVPVRKTGTFRFALTFLVVVLLGLGVVSLGPVVVPQVSYLLSFSQRQEREQLCQYLEEDTGRRVESIWDGTPEYKNLYRLWDQPDITFTAQAEGERNLAAGQLGYTTNFSNIMLTHILEDFAEEQECELWFLDGETSRSSWMFDSSVPQAYCLEVPMWSGEELLTALGSLMSQTQQENWYQTLPPQPFEFYFVYSGFEDVIWYTYTSDKPFDSTGLLDYYQNSAGAAVCSYLVEQSGLGEADFGGAEYRLEPRSTVELPSFFERTQRFARVDGVLADTGETARIYLYSSGDLYSLAPEIWAGVQDTDDLRGDYFEPTGGDADLLRHLTIRRK